MQPFENFIEFYEKTVTPLALLNQKRLDGAEKGGSRTVFARFKDDKGNVWKVHEDALIQPLSQAYQAYKNGSDPFVVIKTPKGTGRLTLKSDAPKGTKGLYIYRNS